MTKQRCVNYAASYCEAHDYDHVLERREQELRIDSDRNVCRVERRALHNAAGVLVTEASDIDFRGAETLMVPDRQGTPRLFALASVDRDERENEVTGWRFANAALGLTILVVND